MEYHTFQPSSDLAPIVKCYWTLDNQAQLQNEAQTIVPDGCMEMIFHYGGLYEQYVVEDSSWMIQPRCFVFGQLSRPLTIRPTGVTGIISVRFYPDTIIPLGVPVTSLTDKAVSLITLFEDHGQNVSNQVLECSTAQERILHIESFLRDRMTHKKSIDATIKSTLDIMLDTAGSLSVEELSKRSYIGRRQLERKFAKVIGLSPKQLSKTIRLQATLRALINRRYERLSDLAFDHDYFDQAHFIKDFKEFTGVTPKEFYGTNLEFSTLFYKDE